MKKTVFGFYVIVTAIVAMAQPNAPEAPRAYWGFETGGADVWVPSSLGNSIQNRYSATLSGETYSAGLVRFHGSGAPNFSLDFLGFSVNAKATDLKTTYQYQGSANVMGFMASKHASFVTRKRYSFGMSFGGGVAPQLQAKYEQTIGPSGFLTQQKTYTLKEIPVTPLFEVLFRGDIRVSRNLSVGPIAGLRSGFPVFGGVLRVHLPQNR
jgi:hypothetical protein